MGFYPTGTRDRPAGEVGRAAMSAAHRLSDRGGTPARYKHNGRAERSLRDLTLWFIGAMTKLDDAIAQTGHASPACPLDSRKTIWSPRHAGHIAVYNSSRMVSVCIGGPIGHYRGARHVCGVASTALRELDVGVSCRVSGRFNPWLGRCVPSPRWYAAFRLVHGRWCVWCSSC